MSGASSLDRQGVDDTRTHWPKARESLKTALNVDAAGLPHMVEDILSSILNISSEGIILTDARQNILLFSHGAEVIFGYSAEEVVGQPLEILISPELRADHGALVDGFGKGPVSSRRMGKSRGVTGYTKDGRLVPVEVGLSRLMTRNGLIFTAIIRDISETIRAEAALNQALILNDVLDLSKIEAGKLELDIQEFDLETLLERTQETFSTLAMQKGLAFKSHVRSAAKGAYLGDPLRLRQVLSNLTSNAIKFTDRGEVRVTVDRVDDVLTLTVSDSGIGIPVEIQQQIFNKFEQGDLTASRRYGGTGLGLSICRDLVQLMGGTIEVQSLPGAGTSFCVRVPLDYVGQVPSLPEITAQPSGPEARSASSMRLLVAEDNRANQLVIDTLLRQAGITPVIVPDGKAAVSAWEADRWDLILMDVQMPEMDGPTATAIIRRREQDRRQDRTPILALTANAMDHQVVEYRHAGMDGVIAKPIEVAKLFSAISEATRTPA